MLSKEYQQYRHSDTVAIVDLPGIYEIRNKVNGKFYIGSTTNLRKRRNMHFSQLHRGIHTNRHLQSSYSKHGSNAFEFITLCISDPETLLLYEQRFIDKLNPPYNISRDASSNRGVLRTEEYRRKMSRSKKGKKLTFSPGTLEKKRQSMLGNKRSLGKRTFGRVLPPESIDKIRAARKKQTFSQESQEKKSHTLLDNSAKGIGVTRFTLEQREEILQRYLSGESPSKLAKEFGVNRSTIHANVHIVARHHAI